WRGGRFCNGRSSCWSAGRARDSGLRRTSNLLLESSFGTSALDWLLRDRIRSRRDDGPALVIAPPAADLEVAPRKPFLQESARADERDRRRVSRLDVGFEPV